jgi:hypothetical protein
MYRLSFTFYTPIKASGRYQRFFLIDHSMLCKPVPKRMVSDVRTENTVDEIYTRFYAPPCVGSRRDCRNFHTVNPNKQEWNTEIQVPYVVQLVMWIPDCQTLVVVCFGFRDKPRMYYSLAGLLYRPIWTFQVGPPDASAPADVSRTPCLHACRRVPHSSSGSWNFMGGEMKPNFA